MDEHSNPPSNPSSQDRKSGGTLIRNLFVAVVVAGVFGFLYWRFGEYFTPKQLLPKLAAHESTLREYGRQQPVLVVGASFLIYVVVMGFSVPVAWVFTMGIGWLFKIMFGEFCGLLIALIVVSFASTSGATLAFLMSRYLFRDAIQRKFGDRLAAFNRALEREGAFYLFTLRLIPAVPFVVINPVMGLTPIRVWTYWWVSQLGMLAGTAVFVYAGSQLPSLQKLKEHGAAGVLTPQIIIAFVLLGIFPIAIQKLMAWVQPVTPQSDD